MEYIRRISQTFIDDLNIGKLKRLLEIVKANNDLQLEIRKNYIQVYYSGGQLLKIEQKRDGYKIDFDIKYCLAQQYKDFVSELKTKRYDIESWLNSILTLKNIMQEWHSEKNKSERQIQQFFCKENVNSDSQYFVIDMEYQIGSLSRVDMLGLTKRDNKLKIVLIELKQKNGALYGKAGLTAHYKDFIHLIKNYHNDLIETVKNIYSNKVAIGLIPNCFDLSTLSDFEILFVLYDYNEKGALDKVLNEITELNETIPFNCKKKSKDVFII